MKSNGQSASDMLKVTRLLPVGCAVIALLLWVAHLYLPVLQREPAPLPGWMQIYFLFLPIAGWILMLSHVLFLSAIVVSVFHRWRTVLLLIVPAADLLLVFGPGPIALSGVQVLWAAYFTVFLAGAAGLALVHINGASFSIANRTKEN